MFLFHLGSLLSGLHPATVPVAATISLVLVIVAIISLVIILIVVIMAIWPFRKKITGDLLQKKVDAPSKQGGQF